MLEDPNNVKKYVQKLGKILSSPLPEREQLVFEFVEEGMVHEDGFEYNEDDKKLSIIYDLVEDITYYEPNPEWREEVPGTYFDDVELERKINEAFEKLKELGVDVDTILKEKNL